MDTHLLLIITLLAILSPAEIHLLIMIFDELRNPSYLTVAEDATVLEYRITIAQAIRTFLMGFKKESESIYKLSRMGLRSMYSSSGSVS